MILTREFYLQKTEEVAKKLLGCYLMMESPDGKKIGKIVETEAYLALDPASHSYKGKNKRNSVMYGEAGYLYVYLIYGVHYCINIVTAKKDTAEAVLIRAVEPIENINEPTNGPSKLAKAYGITLEDNGVDITKKPLCILSNDHFGIQENFKIIATPRIGITKAANLNLRYYIKNNKFVSGKKV